ncbi:protein YIPF5-like [Zingiber officinale]|uniref:protein YIPF5-like n=1 Tax=Zingiber officinale TaxID=94328 RepID=UPI001C4DC321|nr:protein YIPF5-like [Zingiber officinale]
MNPWPRSSLSSRWCYSRIHQPGLAPPPTFNPSRPAIPIPSNPNIPFMSFDVGVSQASSPFFAPVLAASAAGGGYISASGSFEDAPPLFEELGINTRQIWRKTVSILNPIRLKPDLHENTDLAGPFVFLMAFDLFQLLAGKFHFGIILGWVTSRPSQDSVRP